MKATCINENWRFYKNVQSLDLIKGAKPEIVNLPHTWNNLDGQLLKSRAPGMVVFISSARPAHRFLLIKMNIFIWMPIRKIKQLLRL